MQAGRVVLDGPAAEVLQPERIQAVFGLPIHLMNHPETGRPVVVPGVLP